MGTAAPVGVSFLGVVGTSCGAMLPTDNRREVLDGIDVRLMDVAMPMMKARASDFGLTGQETAAELDANTKLFTRMKAMRLRAGPLMVLGDVSRSVMPKIGLLPAPTCGGTISAPYFMPHKTHSTMAVTGSQCIAACALTPGTVADGLATLPTSSPALIAVEHPQGSIEVTVNYTKGPDGTVFNSAGLIRSGRLITHGRCSSADDTSDPAWYTAVY